MENCLRRNDLLDAKLTLTYLLTSELPKRNNNIKQ